MNELETLNMAVNQLPVEHQHHLAPALRQLEKSYQQRVRTLALIQEVLSKARLDLKYIVFDLEATRRERDLLKAQLEK